MRIAAIWIALTTAACGACKGLAGSADGSGESAGLFGRWLVTFDRVRSGKMSGYRIATYDVETGERGGRLTRKRHVSCTPAPPDRLWCRLNSVLALLSLPELDEVADVDDLVAAAGLAKVADGPQYHFVRGALVVLLVDGRAAEIAPDTLAVKSIDTYAPRSAPHNPPPTCREVERADVAGVAWTLGQGTRSAIIRDKVATSTTLLDPHYLVGGVTPDVLVVHRREVGDADRMLSALDAEGRVRWTIPFGEGTCQNLIARGEGRLVILTSSLDLRVMALDAATGTPRWTVSY